MDGVTLSVGNQSGAVVQTSAQAYLAPSDVALSPLPPSPTIAQAVAAAKSVQADSDNTTAASVASQSSDNHTLLKKSAEQLNQNVQPHFGSLQFSVDSGSGKMMLLVIDKETNNLLLQIPSKEALILSETIGSGGSGHLIRESA
ncbi:flagellar protein FlaG [Undibacterium griseum]|uniref:Flagellar protein FlaG n=1 Tax=Undibacterium griseum TaxID=2762295 RepID=A0ABR6YNS2_9BURK|nr:flagellar protein FlaG [Undibacterium griseum]MBC3885459.1 flagellar protein FlaG [Undibacterium griseum]